METASSVQVAGTWLREGVGARPRPREQRGQGASWRGRRVKARAGAAVLGARRGRGRSAGGSRAKSGFFPPCTSRAPRRRSQAGGGRPCANLSRWERATVRSRLPLSGPCNKDPVYGAESFTPIFQKRKRKRPVPEPGMRRGEGTGRAGRPGPLCSAAGNCRSCHAAAQAPRGRAPGREATPPGARPEPGRTRLPSRGARRPRSGESRGRGQVTPKPLPF